MLLIYFGERFPLGKAVQHVGKSPIQFWTKEKVKEMIYNERNNNSGVLYPTGKDNKAKKDCSESNFVASLDPVLKDLYANLMGIINDGHKKLVASVEDELRKAQTHIERQWKQQVGEEDDGEDSQDGHDYEAQEGHRDGHHDDDGHHGSEARYEDDAYQDDASIGTPINIDESMVKVLVSEGLTKENNPNPLFCTAQHCSTRGWCTTRGCSTTEAKEDKEEKEILFDIISGPYTEDERQQILIQIDDEDITREQLQTLGRRNRLSNRVMSVVCKTLMLDMKREGQSQVRRHIFSADQMNLLNIKPVGWKVSEWKQQLLPQYIGYNMCDCDLIMGPMLVAEHWFCMAIDPSTMNFYVLDSMNTKVYLSKNQASNKKKTAGASPQAKAIAKIRERFEDIIQFVNPNHNTKRPRTEDIWPSVPQQPNLQDCGAHVLIWLHNWSPGELMHQNVKLSCRSL
ncbi:hypothetical protein K1719_045143 [Acacia pycnantha]|nr:hypothetical protein K1719_045143 [Acacia pycnantha]